MLECVNWQISIGFISSALRNKCEQNDRRGGDKRKHENGMLKLIIAIAIEHNFLRSFLWDKANFCCWFLQSMKCWLVCIVVLRCSTATTTSSYWLTFFDQHSAGSLAWSAVFRLLFAFAFTCNLQTEFDWKWEMLFCACGMRHVVHTCPCTYPPSSGCYETLALRVANMLRTEGTAEGSEHEGYDENWYSAREGWRKWGFASEKET